MRIAWHPLASADLAELLAYIAADNPNAAYRVQEEIRTQTEKLAQHPEIGRRGRVRGTRELVVTRTPYIAAYCIVGDTVTILRVLHGARRWPRKL
ncbi:MAG TPA: type II toxin-antitoxin system RelE/ParE family toxin [Candidatus Binataceae bacterium]|nr:type II toxin-antitoxin system RelE/ParE family toxin [Candidatus Binataceae bacterium]